MRKYEQVPATGTVNRMVEESCDLCGKINIGDWGAGGYSVEEIEISHKDGESYPEGGRGTEYEVDMCPDCFKNKLIPWLESQGCKVKRTDWSW